MMPSKALSLTLGSSAVCLLLALGFNGCTAPESTGDPLTDKPSPAGWDASTPVASEPDAAVPDASVSGPLDASVADPADASVADSADASVATDASTADAGAQVLSFQVLGEMPHDTTAFTEGFEIADGGLYEGTGLVGSSQLRELDPATGAVRRFVALPSQMFGEGITVVGDRIWQLTYQDGVALQWDLNTFTLLRQVPITGDGWGLCHDGSRLVRSDGTDKLRFHDPATFAEVGSVLVTLNGAPLRSINELECVGGEVWANVFPTGKIVRIDPSSGRVTGIVDVFKLINQLGTPTIPSAKPWNGIAATENGNFLITGKKWPKTFLVKFTP